MKKLLALFLAALFIFSTATVIVSAGTIGAIQRDEQNIAMVPYLDFNKEANDLWAVEDDNGNWSSKIEYGDYLYPGNEDYTPIAAYLRDNQFNSGRKYSFIENGEVLHVEITGDNATPGLWFVLDEEHNKTIPVGSESADNKKAEYVKIRVRNHSACDRFTFGFVTSGTNTYKWVAPVVSDLKVDANGKQYKAASGEWETYVFSMAVINAATNYNDLIPANPDGTPGNRWYGELESFILFPFGYDVEDGTAPYVGAEIDIDYVVIGSKEYVTNYESELEKKEKSIEKLEIVTEPTKKTYYVGESLDLEGLQLKATYKDGTTEMFDSATFHANLEEGAESTPVTLSFGDKTATYNVKVIGVDHIELKEKPSENPTYEAAEISGGFTPTGYTFEVFYTDGTSNDKLPANKFNCTTGDLTTPGKKNITAKFYGFETTFEVEVISVTDIKVTAPTKKLYYKDKVEADDFTYTLVFSDGSELSSDDAKTTLEYTVSVDTKKAGDVTATITAVNATYGVNLTKEVTVKYETPTALKVVSEPIKKTYQPGDTFDAEGLAVALVYEDKNIALDKEDFRARANLNNPGTPRVTVECLLDDFKDLKLEENITVTVEGDVTPPEPSSSSTTRAPQGSNDGGISPVIIIVIVVVVLAAAGVVVFLVIKKKKK